MPNNFSWFTLILLTSPHLTTHLPPLTLSPHPVSLGLVSVMPSLFCWDGLPAVMQEFPRLACLFSSPPSSLWLFTSLYVMCPNQQFSHIYPFPLCLPVHQFIHDSLSRFSHSSVGGHQMANSGQAQPSDTSFNTERKEHVREMASLG